VARRVGLVQGRYRVTWLVQGNLPACAGATARWAVWGCAGAVGVLGVGVGGVGSDFHQVPKKCAELGLVCMAVSRFFAKPIQKTLSENKKLALRPFQRGRDPSGVGGYMKEVRVERLSAS
jgi:hypothetical protein